MGWRSMGQEFDKEDCILVMDRRRLPEWPLNRRQDYAGDVAVLVSVCSYEGGVPRGAFISFDYNQRYEFQGLDQMLLKMEDLMDSVAVPCPAFEHRSFYGKPYICQEAEPGRRMSVGLRRRPEDMPKLPRGKASFELRVYYRQHGSMQGEMAAAVLDDSGAEREKKVPFRSALELMRLIHEYLNGVMRLKGV